MAQRLSVDRIDGIAVLEQDDRAMRMVPLQVLPAGLKEGDILLERGGKYTIDHSETIRRREYNKKLFERLKKN